MEYFEIYGQEVKKVLNEVKKLYSDKLLNRLYYFYKYGVRVKRHF